MTVVNRELRHLLGKAIHHYRLIEDGDRIAVAVSGGKDSLVLLWLLRERLSWIPVHYDLVAIHVDPGFDRQSSNTLQEYFESQGFAYRIIHTDHGLRAHSDENRENPCFLCSRLRRKTLFKTARDLGCVKLALGHNQDDFLETFFINILYGGQVAGILPRQPFFGGQTVVIRPLALLPSNNIERFARHLQLPVVVNACPTAGVSKRQKIRAMLETLYDSNSKVRGNILHAMSHVNLEYLPPPLGSAGDGCANLLDVWSRRGYSHPRDGSPLED
jgi:tRNA 2-thiocytidine biosynthesis protein TtcA